MRNVIEPESIQDFTDRLSEIEKDKDFITAVVVGVMGVSDQMKIWYACDRTADLGGLMFLLDARIKDCILAEIDEDQQE